MSAPTMQEARLFFDQNMAQAELVQAAGGKVAVFSARSPDKATPNEDAAAVIPYDERSAVLIVADGLGGVSAGDQASAIAIRQMQIAVEEAARDGSMLRTAILNGFENANRAVQQLGVGAATTLAVVEIQDDQVRPYHVGDSVILVTGQRGRIKLHTISHSPVGYAVEAGLLDHGEAMHHEERHLVSNVIGASDMRIEIGSTIQLAARDTLLLASDGLLDNLHVDEIVERMRKGSLAKVVQRLVADAQARMHRTAPPAELPAAVADTTGEQTGSSPIAGNAPAAPPAYPGPTPSKPDDLTLAVFRRAT